jgi:hypothetical protein
VASAQDCNYQTISVPASRYTISPIKNGWDVVGGPVTIKSFSKPRDDFTTNYSNCNIVYTITQMNGESLGNSGASST